MQKPFPISISSAEFSPLEVVPNSNGTPKLLQIVDPEFSSVCPKTGLPDYGRVILRYVPDEFCVELKAWKLYLRSFYGVGCFHEDCTQRIADAFVNIVNPSTMILTIDWGARGGLHTTTRLIWLKNNGYVCDIDHFNDSIFLKSAKDWQNQ